MDWIHQHLYCTGRVGKHDPFSMAISSDTIRGKYLISGFARPVANIIGRVYLPRNPRHGFSAMLLVCRDTIPSSDISNHGLRRNQRLNLHLCLDCRSDWSCLRGWKHLPELFRNDPSKLRAQRVACDVNNVGTSAHLHSVEHMARDDPTRVGGLHRHCPCAWLFCSSHTDYLPWATRRRKICLYSNL